MVPNIKHLLMQLKGKCVTLATRWVPHSNLLDTGWSVVPILWLIPLQRFIDQLFSSFQKKFENLAIGVDHLTFEGGWVIFKKISCKHTCTKKCMHMTTGKKNHTHSVNQNMVIIYTHLQKKIIVHEITHSPLKWCTPHVINHLQGGAQTVS